jgi:hypothetical protein
LPTQFFVAELGKKAGILIANHGDAGGRGDDDSFSVLIEAGEALGLAEGFAAETCVGMHLSAARLLGTKVERDAQSFE